MAISSITQQPLNYKNYTGHPTKSKKKNQKNTKLDKLVFMYVCVFGNNKLIRNRILKVYHTAAANLKDGRKSEKYFKQPGVE